MMFFGSFIFLQGWTKNRLIHSFIHSANMYCLIHSRRELKHHTSGALFHR